ncbi:MAG: hypothetical protein J0I86_16035, partial [Mesorhizobium sp.]|nr:hypothetical protein [Mesorhizobium sp.]
RHLAAEVDDEDGVGVIGRRHGGRLKKNLSRRNGLVVEADNPIPLPHAMSHARRFVHPSSQVQPLSPDHGIRSVPA